MLVNQHLGEATHLWIYDRTDRGYAFMESRAMPPAGGGDRRYIELSEALADCHTVVVAGIGPTPRETLSRHGLSVVECEGLIADTLAALYHNNDIRPFLRREPSGCGTAKGCPGPGTGCG
jgi:nitrogen fixation protein NifB